MITELSAPSRAARVEVLGTGLIYRNPTPHTKSVHAYFPSVATLPNGEMVATFGLAEAFEATNLHSHVARSVDGGETWTLEGRHYPGTRDRLTTDCCRITALPDGELIAFMVRHDRTDHPNEGFTNPDNLGFVPTELLTLRSRDGGRTWSEPETLTPPLVGPCFELCCPVIALRDGRWILPTSTWRDWDGNGEHGMKTVALISYDKGKSWPEYTEVFDANGRPVIYWESKIVEMPDGRLVGAAWGYDESKAADTPNQYVISSDGGKTWTKPRSTDLLGQTLTPFALPDGRILCVYRRIDKPGLWANVSRLEGDDWVNESETPLWGTGVTGLTADSDNMAKNFHVLRFGAPCINTAPDGSIFVAFWGVEDCVSNIRWFRLGVERL